MKKHFQTGSAILDRYRCGPLGPHLGSFANWLSEQGYPRQTGMQKVRLFAFLSRWLERNKISIQQLDEQQIEQFIKTQRKQLRRQRHPCREVPSQQRTPKRILSRIYSVGPEI